MRRALAACGLALALGVTGGAAAQTAWPAYMPQLEAGPSESSVAAVLPTDVKVLRPDTALAPAKARWSGIWNGWACFGRQCDIHIPTLIFNHGSTGDGDKPEWFQHTATAPELAQYFVDRGWQVLMPQRRGRGKSDGLYDEGFEPDRSRYACKAELSLPGVERAVADLDVVMAYVKKLPTADSRHLMIGGISRGGILSVVYAGTRPDAFEGVINFVGGWLGGRCEDADHVNSVLFRRGAAFQGPQIWLYGDKDPFYSLSRSRKNFDDFVAAARAGS